MQFKPAWSNRIIRSEQAQCLKSTWAALSEIREETDDRRLPKQPIGETEVEFDVRISQAAHSCCKTFGGETGMTYFVDKHHLAIHSIVPNRYKAQSQKTASYLRQVGAESYKQKTIYRGTTRKVFAAPAVERKKMRTVQFTARTLDRSNAHITVK